MDDSERLAEQYLFALGRGAVVFEPDGNVPPDFSLNRIIGVEVRRLNQNYQRSDGSTEGLEELAIPLWQRLKRLLLTLGPSVGGESWFVCMGFRRPFSPWQPLQVMIEQELLAFKDRATRSRTTIQITQNFELNLIRAGKDHGTFFLLGASSDDDSGGWVMSEVERNLRLCIAEKERKIERYRSQYSEWWLVLADHISYSMDPEDREIFRADMMPSIRHTFDQIVLIDPRDHRRAFEI
ncbi:MAG: hypothetical protein JWN85_3075 [Gammaproteobacteria bacterium]|nr:hypothetical protein [Gammaproteobacteria bacterium]